MLIVYVATTILVAQVVGVFGSGNLELHMVSHTNTAGTYVNNTICDGGAGVCDPYFTFCVDHFMGNDNPESCLYHMLITGSYVDQNDVTFSTSFTGGAPNPFSVPFNTLNEDHVMLKVDVWDEDATNAWIDQYNVFIPVKGPAPTAWSNKTVQGARPNDKTSLVFQYRIYCDENWYGSSCSVYCLSTINPLDGQFTCDPETGEKICNPGWTDPSSNCSVNIDECASSPCLNLGYCQDKVNGFRCVCLQGVNGTYCEDNMDECLSNPCLNGGNCVDDFDGYICDCTYNYYGDNCEHNRPKATQHRPKATQYRPKV